MELLFKAQKAFLSNVNPRSEFHGDERQGAGDLNFKTTVSNDRLADFDPRLKAFLYRLDSGRVADLADQAKMDEPGFLPHLAMPDLAVPLKWKGIMESALVTIKPATGDPIVLVDAKLAKFELTPKEPGIVEITFQVQAHPSKEHWAPLCDGIAQTEVELTVEKMTEKQGSLVPPVTS